MESMTAYCASPKFEDPAETSTSFLSSTFIDEFAYSVSTHAFESSVKTEQDDDAIDKNDAIRLANNNLMKELEISRKKIKRLENDLTYYQKHVDSIEEEHNQLMISLTDYEKKIRKKDEKLEILEKTVCTLKGELESFYNTDASANETTSSASELHGTLSYSSDSANNMQVTYSENKAVQPKKEKDEPECDVLKEFISKYNESLEENFKLKEEVNRLKKEIVDLTDILNYRDQIASTNCIDTLSPPSTPSLQFLSLADELNDEMQDMPLPSTSASIPIDNASSVALSSASVEESQRCDCDHSSHLFPWSHFFTLTFFVFTFSVGQQLKALSFKRLPISPGPFRCSWFITGKKLMYFVFSLSIVLIWKGLTLFEPAIKLRSELKPYYTIQEIITDFFNQLALYF